MGSEASVAEVACERGFDTNQVFEWRRAFKRGELEDSHSTLLPVTVSTLFEANKASELVPHQAPHAGGSIHIKFPGRALIHVERSAEPDLFRCVFFKL